MKKQTVFLSLSIVSTMLLASCHKQSRLDIESINGSATIIGTAMYDAGAISKDEPYSQDWRPASGKTVIVSVAYTEYSSGSSQGYKTFTCTVNSTGHYEISIPVSAAPVSATVSLIPFTDTKKVVVDEELRLISNALFNSNTVNLSIKDKFTYEANLEATSDATADNY